MDELIRAPRARHIQPKSDAKTSGWQSGRLGLWPIALAAIAFMVVEFRSYPLNTGFSWDEAVYVSQVSIHAPAAIFSASRSRGVPLIVAPVTLLTGSISVLRAYLAVASGLALFGSLATWRRFRPAWVLAVAGVLLGGLWVTQFYGPAPMPNLWQAFTALAGTGFFLQCVVPAEVSPSRRRASVIGLIAMMASATLIRFTDGLILASSLLAAMALTREWRNWRIAAAIATASAAGAAEWIIEAIVRYHGIGIRLRQASAAQGQIGLHNGIWAELRALNGPAQCDPCLVPWQHPALSIWWLATPLLVAVGILAGRRSGQFRESALAAWVGLGQAAQYLFLIDFAAARFLLPAYALLAIPAADAAAWLVTSGRLPIRLASGAAAAGLVIAQSVSQHTVLQQQVTIQADWTQLLATASSDLNALGVRSPCAIYGSNAIQVGFDAGCLSDPNPGLIQPSGVAGPGQHTKPVFVLLLEPTVPPPAYVRGWRHVMLKDLPGYQLLAYLPPA